MSKQQGTPDRAILPFEKALVASELGMTRESFSRALSSLGRSGIRVDGQMIAILDGPRLAAECKIDSLIDGADTDDFVV
ncbi:helix-turn-helix domain-containing protein [Mesorhizobium sp. PAMC28654]|uniref:helix-turn-helix domain-containing protein n=1 Tax=Mesorhizobium sp. PAMC28654 TaxID=2880934 RepID=UPI001D0A267B|nr:helix-turn-helix domain-containing protein [Mesorhizobium sp. PAMC28654]UDL90622.1 helix-turn-helix domain-containing protein [Mesorhizobium sp. PAMC28654]